MQTKTPEKSRGKLPSGRVEGRTRAAGRSLLPDRRAA